MPDEEIPEHVPDAVMSKEDLVAHVQQSRSERYVRTAHFVQGKWFIIIASAGIILFLIVTYLVSR